MARAEDENRFQTAAILPTACLIFHCLQGWEGTFVLHDNARVHLGMNAVHQDHEPEIAVYLQSDKKQNKTKQFCQAVPPWFNIEKADILRKTGKSDQNWKEEKTYFIQNWIY